MWPRTEKDVERDITSNETDNRYYMRIILLLLKRNTLFKDIGFISSSNNICILQLLSLIYFLQLLLFYNCQQIHNCRKGNKTIRIFIRKHYSFEEIYCSNNMIKLFQTGIRILKVKLIFIIYFISQ